MASVLPLLLCPDCGAALRVDVDWYRMVEAGPGSVEVTIPAACADGCGLQLASSHLWTEDPTGRPQLVSYTVTALRSSPRWQRDPDGHPYLPTSPAAAVVVDLSSVQRAKGNSERRLAPSARAARAHG